MLKCMDCGAEGVSGIHGCNWTGKDSPVTRVEFDALTQRLNTDERRAWDANARINDAVFALTQRVAALEAERTPQSGPRLCPDCFTVVPVGHQCRVPPTVRVSESGSAPSPAPPAAPDRCPGPLPTGSLCSHGKTVRLEWPGCLLCGPANCQHAKEAPHDIDPPAAPSLLPCPFCGEPGYNIGSSCDPCVGCLSCEFELSPDRWNRRPPADARLRALAEAVVSEWKLGAITTGLSELAAYLRETAR